MGAGGAAAAPYSRAANDECRICGGRFLVSNSLYDLTRHIFLSFSLCDKTQQASVTGKKTLLLERGFLLALKRRKGVVVFTVLGARTTEAKARSIRFGFGFDPKLSRVKGKRQRGVEGARKRERSVGTVSSVVVTRPRRGKVVSIPLRVIFVVLVECPFGISDLSLDLMNERERDRIVSHAAREDERNEIEAERTKDFEQ